MGTVQTTLQLVKDAMKSASQDIGKAAGYLQGSATSGLTFYDLQAPALSLFPILTPFRNTIPRRSGKGGTQANWRAVTGINTTNVRAGVSEGNRGAAITHTTADYLAAFKGFGLEDFVNFEAQYAGQGFQDIYATAVVNLLRATMIAEENLIVGGDTSQLLGVTPTPTVSQNTDAVSSVTNSTLSVICVALGYRAWQELNGYNNGTTGSVLGLAVDPNTVAVVTKTNVDASTDVYNGGTAQKSAAATVTIDAQHQGCKATVTAVPGAFGYAWYWGVGASEVLGAITQINSVQITADGSTSFAVGANLAADKSTSVLDFDGLLTQCFKTSSGGYVKALATGVAGTGTQLTADGAGGCNEINNMCQDRYTLLRLGFDELWMGAQVFMDLNSLVIKNGGAPLIRFGMDPANPGSLDAGVALSSIQNKITGQRIKVGVHPNIPAGVIFGRCLNIPYPLSGISDPVRMLMRQDYYQMEFPMVKRRREYGIYADGVLQNFFPAATGIIYNIAPGIA